MKIHAGERQCKFCRKRFTIDELKHMWYNNNYYCNECFLKIAQIPNTEQLIEDKKSLIQYVQLLFSQDYLVNKFSNDLVRLLKKGFTYQGILATLKFIWEIKKKGSHDYGVFQVDWEYHHAKQYYDVLYDQHAKMQNQTVQIEYRQIFVTKPVITYTPKLFDLSSEGERIFGNSI